MAQLPQINIDPFRVCFFQQWRPGEFSFIILAISFGMSSYPQPQMITINLGNTDVHSCPLRLGVICRCFRILYDYHRSQRTKTEGSVKCSNPRKNNSARRDGIFLPHVYLSTGALFLLVPRSGELIPDTSWAIRRVLFITSARVSRYRFSSCRECKLPPSSIRIRLQMADMNVYLLERTPCSSR